jgi:outer membrane protein TolC
MKNTFLLIIAFILNIPANAQNKSLDYFLVKAEENAKEIQVNNNLLKIGELQNTIITAQNNGFKVDATSEILVAPFFNSNGRVIEITTMPSNNAYGYDAGVTNGGLYSAQVNVTKSLFNKAATDNLLFQNKIQNNTISLSSEAVLHNLKKNIIDTYIIVYQYQLQENFAKTLKTDLEKRLQVVELLVKRGILLESDYLLLKLDVDAKDSEIQQIQANLNMANAQLYSLCGMPIEDYLPLEMPDLSLKNNANAFFYQKKFENDSLQLIADQNVFENQYKPQVTAYGNTGLNAIDASNIPHNFGLSVGVKLSIPIYDGQQKKQNALQNELKQESLNFYKENNQIQLQNNLKSIEEQMNALEQNKLLTDAQIKQQEKILEIYKGKLVKGETSVIDYLNLIQNYNLTVYIKLQMQTNLWLLYNQYNYTNW